MKISDPLVILMSLTDETELFKIVLEVTRSNIQCKIDINDHIGTCNVYGNDLIEKIKNKFPSDGVFILKSSFIKKENKTTLDNTHFSVGFITQKSDLLYIMDPTLFLGFTNFLIQ
jgi:hypothetical protein